MKKNILQNSLRGAGLLLIGALFCTSCTGDFLNINTNPYQPTDHDMHGDNYDVGGFFSQLEQNVIATNGNEFQMSQNLIGDIYGGYMGAINNYFENKNNSTYSFPIGWLDHPFKHVYANELGAWINIKNKISKKTGGHPEQSDIYQLAQIIKIASMSRLSDLWGPIPYSKAGSGGLQTPYDSQEDVYHLFFKQLDDAEAVLTDFLVNNPGKKPLEKFDLVYDGDYNQWLKFANSLRLRLAMRIVFVDRALARQEAEKAVGDAAGLIDVNADNASVKSGHGVTINNPLETMWNSYGDCRAGANIVSVMNGYKDPRRSFYFQKSPLLSGSESPYVGVRTGIEISAKGDHTDYSSPNVQISTPLVWMNAAEVSFLKAEAALYGWNVGVTPQFAYENGVSLSFQEHGASGVSDYLADAGSRPAAYVSPKKPEENIPAVSTITIKWDESADLQTKLERIITQKWIAVYPDGQEAWSEFRRTGYPRLFPVKVDNEGDMDNTPTRQIARYPFPNSEYTLNVQNIQKAVRMLGGPDKGSTRLWWDKNPNKPQR